MLSTHALSLPVLTTVLTPSLVAALQSGAHGVDVTDALERIIDTTVSDIDNHLLNRLVVILWIDALSCTQLLSQFKLGWVGINCENASGANRLSGLDASKTDTRKKSNYEGQRNGVRNDIVSKLLPFPRLCYVVGMLTLQDRRRRRWNPWSPWRYW